MEKIISEFHWKINFNFRRPRDSFKLQSKQPPTVMPNIKPRPNLHAQHHNLDTLERLVFEDFNATPYTSVPFMCLLCWPKGFCQQSFSTVLLFYS